MKCTNCGRELSDDARFCEICGKPVGTEPTLVADKTTEVDPRYDLSVFSDDSAPASAVRHTPEPVVEDDAAKTVFLPGNGTPDFDIPTRPERRAQANRFPVEDDAAKTELLPEQNEPTAERNRFEENIAMHRRYREERKRADRNRTTNVPLRAGEDQGFVDEYRGYAPADQFDDRSRYDRRPRYGDEHTRYGYNDSNHRENYRSDRGSYEQDARREQRPDRRNADGKRRKNNQKKALIISIIALVLVIAILAGVIFFVNRNTVSASELRDAKNKYLPPAQAVTIDTSQKDPSNSDIQFKYDDRARILSCTYKANEKPYEQQYTYRDPDRMLDIETTYRDKLIHTESISYDKIKTANDFEDVDGYIVRLDEESLTAGETLPPTVPPTAAPTAAPTEARTIVDAQSDEAMTSFLQRFVSCYAFNVGEFEYNYTDKQSTNILEKVCQQFSIADWELYSGNARIEGWYQSSSNYTGLSPADAPWMDESKVNGAMGVVANRCDTADWICTNIFNVNAGDLPTLYEQCYANQKLWKAEASVGTSYCAVIYGRGLIGFKVNIRDVKTDGRFYYVTYDRCDYNSVQVYETLYAVMEKKTIDGGTYWSMYSNTNNIPGSITPFTPE